MQNYHELLQTVLDTGVTQVNRTGVSARFIPGAMLRYDLQKGFPAITTKRLAFGAVKGELIGFLHGCQSAADFRALNCNIWTQNANENQAWLNNPNRKGTDDLGRIYGAIWRDFNGIDQLKEVVSKIINTPTDRRIIMSAWKPDEFDKMALPPCHVLYQFLVDTVHKRLHLCMYQRSCDLFLGVPFNIASCALLLSLVAEATGYTAGSFTHFLADVHIYENHVEQVKLQLSRQHLEPPKLRLAMTKGDGLKGAMDAILGMSPEDIVLVDYNSHAAIPAPMAV
jgi:thymidylate synthase